MSTMWRASRRRFVVVVLTGAIAGASLMGWRGLGTAADTKTPTAATAPGGWAAAAPRDEIRPDFAYDPHGGPSGLECLVIKADRREGLDGYWTIALPVAGGKHYRF